MCSGEIFDPLSSFPLALSPFFSFFLFWFRLWRIVIFLIQQVIQMCYCRVGKCEIYVGG
ncbi:hypothetical protein CWATWH0005_1817 [Crocosphaera watsonii WH 0005]|uniref:Uncharacterized protein n=1 Tax=Crocosphaera watsonii WH 0005 TaxID=423472 RepID=T2IPM7_CROWT|nr:hypothetical protein CWATWH0005_1817 [Crocosphaera watsonii WH 0005]